MNGAELDTWEAGYRAGYATGHEVGYGLRDHEERQRWRVHAKRIAMIARLVPFDELERRRVAPSGDAYRGALIRRGGREYTGGPVRYDTGALPVARPARHDPTGRETAA